MLKRPSRDCQNPPKIRLNIFLLVENIFFRCKEWAIYNSVLRHHFMCTRYIIWVATGVNLYGLRVIVTDFCDLHGLTGVRCISYGYLWFLQIHSTLYIRTVVSLQWHQICFVNTKVNDLSHKLFCLFIVYGCVTKLVLTILSVLSFISSSFIILVGLCSNQFYFSWCQFLT